MSISEKLQIKLIDGGWKGKLKLDILNDICVKYAKEFFGDVKRKGYSFYIREGAKQEALPYEFHTIVILELLQQNKIQEAEDYILEHCLFNPANQSDNK